MRKSVRLKLKRNIVLFLCFFILGSYSNRLNASAENLGSKSVLIINSYQNGLSWTDSEEEGMIETLHTADIKSSIYIEYMDWKNYPTKENLENFYSNLYYKYAKKHLDVIITSDDAALEFALNNRQDLFPDTPIVFCGVNERGMKKVLQNNSYVTGVVERVDVEKTIEAALDINPELKEIAVVYDKTESGISTGELAIQEIHRVAPDVEVKPLNNGTYSDILNQVDRISQDSAILITTYYMDDEGVVVGFEDFCELISKRSPVPVYHLYEFGMNHGAIGGSMLSGKLQGEKAAEIAVKILQGVDVAELPIVKENTTRYIFDYNQLKRFSIPESSIPKDSQILNKPFSFIETYRDIVITTLLIFVLLITFILTLLYYLRKISRMKKKLFDSNIELTNLYEDLTASDEELRQQFEELTDTQRSLMASEERYKKASEEVGKLNTELEQRVITRTRELQQAMQELEAFAYTVSHDLKSPLRAIDGYSKIILEDSRDELKEEVIDMMFHIRGICSDMIEMISKLLQYSTTSRKELQLETVDCNELFAASYREAKYSVPDRRIEFKIETGLPIVQADRTLLKQVLNNIFSNAIKFTKNREITYIIAGATITENDYIFYVKDNGAGFDKNYSEKLFGLFQRLHTSDEFEGSGIGLITIKKIIEKHGGRTWIEGELNKGAVVYFSLPNNGLSEEGQ